MAGAVVADSIGLDIDQYYKELHSLLDPETNTENYNDSGYNVSFTISEGTGTIVVNFDKEQFTGETPEKENSIIDGEGDESDDDSELGDPEEDYEEDESEVAEDTTMITLLISFRLNEK